MRNQAVQIESGGELRRTVCATCDGTGETEGEPVCACGCRGRACGFRMVRCPDCGGSGHDESAGTAAKARASTGPVSEPTCESMARTMPARALEVPASLGGSGHDAVLAVIRSVACHYCYAPIGRHCRDPKSGRASRVHASRVDRWRRNAR